MAREKQDQQDIEMGTIPSDLAQLNELLQQLNLAKPLVQGSQLFKTVVTNLLDRFKKIKEAENLTPYVNEIQIGMQLLSLMIKDGAVLVSELLLSQKIQEIAKPYTIDLLNNCDVMLMSTEPKLYKLTAIGKTHNFANSVYIRHDNALYFYSKENYSLTKLNIENQDDIVKFDIVIEKQKLVEKEARRLMATELTAINPIVNYHDTLKENTVYIKLPEEENGIIYKMRTLSGQTQEGLIARAQLPSNVGHLTLEKLKPHLETINKAIIGNGHIPNFTTGDVFSSGNKNIQEICIDLAPGLKTKQHHPVIKAFNKLQPLGTDSEFIKNFIKSFKHYIETSFSKLIDGHSVIDNRIDKLVQLYEAIERSRHEQNDLTLFNTTIDIYRTQGVKLGKLMRSYLKNNLNEAIELISRGKLRLVNGNKQEELEVTIAKLKQDHLKAEADLKIQLHAAQKKISDLEESLAAKEQIIATNATLKESNQRLLKENKKLIRENESLRYQLTAAGGANEEIRNLKSENEVIKRRNEVLETRVTSLNSDITSLLEENQLLKDKMKELSGINNQLKSQIKKIQENMEKKINESVNRELDVQMQKFALQNKIDMVQVEKQIEKQMDEKYNKLEAEQTSRYQKRLDYIERKHEKKLARISEKFKLLGLTNQQVEMQNGVTVSDYDDYGKKPVRRGEFFQQKVKQQQDTRHQGSQVAAPDNNTKQ
jgi:hypothetical protein